MTSGISAEATRSRAAPATTPTIYSGDGQDQLLGGNGFDKIAASEGNDYVSVIGDDSGNFVNCGPSKDSVDVMFGQSHGSDAVYENCEISAQ